MNYNGNKAENLKIAYIGGGSRGWAWNLMSDLAQEQQLSGKVYLYDIDFNAAKNNEIIGNKIKETYPNADNFEYIATKTIDEALNNTDFVIISILPGTFEEMRSDVHAPEKFGILQPVGDSTGLGGNIRALRTLPMFEYIALKIKECCPDAWVINYTNPMTLCVKALYDTFPDIKAFGCCHEVFGTQNFLKSILEKEHGITDIKRSDIKVNVTGINHFTWLTKAQYKNIDLFPIYREYSKKQLKIGISEEKRESSEDNWMNNQWRTFNLVKMDLFMKFGSIAAAGDRHLVEFVPPNWYLADKQTVYDWGYALTNVDWRIWDLQNRLNRSQKLVSGEEKFELAPSGEEGVVQIKALLGLGDLTTNVNLPNKGQIPNLPLGAVVETNAVFTANSVIPVNAGNLPNELYGLITPIVHCQTLISEAVRKKDLSIAFNAFICDPQNNLTLEQSKELFKEMVLNTKKYLGMYNLDQLENL